ncbi:peptide ABC transporter permease [Fervidicella metallireducens AeB]|uniref:Peptide ABC transporter permease n=1 Tax=Fervidicella metallireducens AeB TaxID=1403537 RepID=A0A017RX97_9CLOT|nr:ABC transporter permease [Fervidicella metallireducens]EYE89403.1 peptide ABC transporter permease [Fervidicella metallireducens AeB]
MEQQYSSRDFEIVGENFITENIEVKKEKSFKETFKEIPYISVLVLLVIVLGCAFPEIITKQEPAHMDLANINTAPNSMFIFGTDSLGRDIFIMIWYGGRVSLIIGVMATAISTTIAVIYGSISGIASEFIDDVMMRFTEIVLSIPSILIIIFIQAMIGKPNPISISIVIGITGWMNISKIVRSEVRQIRNNNYIWAARCAGGNFLYILRRHLFPNFISSIMFMVVTNVGTAIGIESTLSFLGIGLPIEIISWGSMLSLSEKALLSNYWWIIIIPGIFLVTTLVCITNIGNYIRKKNNQEFSNL